MRFFSVSLALFVSLFIFSSCVKKDQIFEFDNSDPYAVDIETKWVVVTDPYAVCRTDAGYEFSVTGHFRKGDIRRIEGEKSTKISSGKKEVWYCIEEGWISSNAVKVYSNKLKAMSAVKEMNLK
ncbi:MAG: hypothetical protein IJP61_10550 [Treponema sp.]|nr:hypothetical protein [Treponema sp.]